MIERALDAGVPAKWAAGDAVYGQYHRLRRTLEERGLFYVLAVPVSQRVVVKDGSFPGTEKRADQAVRDLVPTAWRTRSAGDGSKGVRDYAWARVRINGAEDGKAEHWLLARRSLAKPEETAYFICHTPKRIALAEMARIAGMRWSIEETFQTAKGEAGLDHYQVRQYTGWYRHITLSMLAHAFLTAVKAKKGAPEPGRKAS
jgi:SRSO17 transposase